jgi:heme/copper-type cytochrome/quinol oxidase subunit 3
MTDTQYDRALGDASALPDVEQGTSSGVLVYTIGLALAVVLTAMSFWVANTSLLCFSLFWHALDIVWVWLFTVVYLMGVVS